MKKPGRGVPKTPQNVMENSIEEILKKDNRSICVGKNTETLVKLMDITTKLYGEIYKAIESVNGENLADNIFDERFSDGFSRIYEGFRKSIGESVYEMYSFKENHTKTLITI